MELLILGLGLGAAAGVSPGPLLTLVVSSTIERGLTSGLRIAAAPILSDAPVILISLLTLGRLPAAFLRSITVVGGIYVAYLGLRTLLDGRRPVAGAEDQDVSAGTDYRRGVLVNLLNPHPWIGWATVMGPLVLEGWRRAPWEAVGFVVSFYMAIIGSKMLIAWLVSRGRNRLEGPWYSAVLVACGLLLVVLGLLLVRQGLLPDAVTMARHFAQHGFLLRPA